LVLSVRFSYIAFAWLDDICCLVGFCYTNHRFNSLAILFFVWQGVLDGKYDDLPEQSFYMVGGIEEVIAKAEKISKESATA